MIISQISVNINVLHFFLLFASLTRYNSSFVNYDKSNENTTQKKEQKENLVDLRKYVDINEELERKIKTKLEGYEEINDFLEKPSIDLVVLLPTLLDENVVSGTVKEIIDNMLSNAFGSSTDKTQSKQPIYFHMEVNKRRTDSWDTQNIKVIFKLTSSTMECLNKRKCDAIDPGLWCSNKIRWNSSEEANRKTTTPPSTNIMRNFEKLKIIDMTAENWIDRLDHFLGTDIQLSKLRRNETTQLDINLLPPPVFHRIDFLMLLKRTNDVIVPKILKGQFVKYLVYPRMHGNKLRDLNMLIRIGPPDLEEEGNQQYIKNMSLHGLIPRLQKAYKNLIFQYVTVFNAVEVDQLNQKENRYRLVLNVLRRNRDSKISFVRIRNIVLEMSDVYKDIHFKSSYNDFDYEDRYKDYLIASFEIDHPTFENTKEFVENISKKLLTFYINTNFPGQLLEMKIKHIKQEYSDMYDDDEYEVTMKFLKGVPDEITPEILKNILESLTKKYPDLKVTCELMENDSTNLKWKSFKVCLKVKKINVKCYNPWTPEGKKEFFSSQMDEIIPAVPPGGTPPKEKTIRPPIGGYSNLGLDSFITTKAPNFF